jgi:ApaG protein
VQLFQHAAVTEGVTVRVAVNFLPETIPRRWANGSGPHIRIENDSAQRFQLLSRHWRITDGRGT